MELKIDSIRNRGEKGERLFIEVLEDCDLGDFILYDETFDADGNKSNVWPHMYRFDRRQVKKGEYISLRVHSGKDRVGTLDDQKTVCYYLYWGFDESVQIFNKDGDIVHLVKTSSEVSHKIL